MEAFDDRLIAVDEFHHVSANPDNKLGLHLAQFFARGKTHIVAMTGSYFRGDSAAVLAKSAGAVRVVARVDDPGFYRAEEGVELPLQPLLLLTSTLFGDAPLLFLTAPLFLLTASLLLLAASLLRQPPLFLEALLFLADALCFTPRSRAPAGRSRSAPRSCGRWKVRRMRANCTRFRAKPASSSSPATASAASTRC